ncbi:MAG: PAS domain S-box protein [Spirochaetaceae bacterium]|nr:MAG: PAS domain S-box protein [Spirochaetaceae bacterium]
MQLSIPNIAVEEDPELTAERFQRIKSHGHALFHAQNWRKDGTPFDVEVSASFLGGEEDRIVVFFRDITERKLAEDRLRESEEKYSSLFDQAVDAIYIHDFEGKIIDVNQATCEQTGYSKNELLQLSVFDIHVTGKETINLSEADTKRVWQQSRVGERRSFEAEHRRKDGAVVPVRLSTGTVRFGNEFIVMAIVEDITERKQAEEEIQRQLAEKENILREVHHRIKNNMAQVEGLLLLQADSTDNPHAQSALQEAISRVRSIRVVYDKLLIGNDYQDLSVKDYVESLVASIVAVFAERRNISIETRLADFALSSQRLIPVGIIINELLTNTFKYAFTGRKDGKVVIQLDKNETHATLSIEDDGVGLDDGGTADTSTGFGLSIVQMLVEQLNGAYSVEINGGTKSVVEFEL